MASFAQDTPKQEQEEEVLDETPTYGLVDSFDDMELEEPLMRALLEMGLERPSAIQQQAIVPIAKGEFVRGHAQSGTGKTFCFMTGAIQRRLSHGSGMILVLSPTRELALQTFNVAKDMSSRVGLTCIRLIGKEPVGKSKRDCRKNPDIVVGTPGRIWHMISDNFLSLKETLTFVIDEADEMLKEGFLDMVAQIDQEIVAQTKEASNPEHSIVMMSATFPEEIAEFAKTLLPKTALHFSIDARNVALEGILQYQIDLMPKDHTQRPFNDNDKCAVLGDLFKTPLAGQQLIIFCRSRREVDGVFQFLQQEYPTNKNFAYIYGEMEDEHRKHIMKSFRAGSIRWLVATDLISRGIDVQQVSLVVNFSMPRDPETYIHRIGRSGRFGRKGLAINFIASYPDQEMQEVIKRTYSIEIADLPDPESL